jgi:dihydrofolate synthase/folylpolyglutamate synthase
MSEYERTLEWLYALEAAKGMDFKLERVALALGRLGDPHTRFRSLHIGGTNGKGSVAAMLESILAAEGYRVGLYTSPHLVDLTERVRVGGRAIAREDLVARASEIRAVAAARGIGLTFFEFLTVLAFLHFARAAVEVAVVEVGLGGRLDATNVLDPIAAAITTIGMDHMQWLGSTLGQIAAEKGGIIKPGRPVVLGRIAGEPAAVLRSIASAAGAPAIVHGRDYDVREAARGIAFEGLGRGIGELRVALRGAHQRDNAATALAVLASVGNALPVSTAAIRRGLADVRWPGRLDVLGGTPRIILDGAHNADGAAALARELPALIDGRPLHLVFAVMKDKDWRPMVESLAPLCASAVVTEVLPPRGAPAAAVAADFRRYCAAVAEPDVRRAWARATAAAGSAGVVLAAGSLFLIGALYADAADPARGAANLPRALHP